MKSPSLTAISPATNIKRPWRHIAIILLPWLVVTIAFHWMATAFPTYHGSDETLYHYPVIVRFFAALPYPDLRDYASATSPLFHVLFALAAKVVGLSLQSLRLVNIAVSLTAVFVFYGLVSRAVQGNEQRNAQGNQALLLALLFGLSPYFFGASFLVLTDNLGILFALLAMRALFRSLESQDMRHWIALCVWTCLATLTRQLYVWLMVGAVLTMLSQKEPMRSGMVKTAGLIAACLPLAALVMVWGGLTPPSFQQMHVAASGFTPRAGVFGIAIFGLYWIALFPDRFIAVLRGVQDRPSSQRYLPLAIILVATVMALLLIPTRPTDYDDGILWRVLHKTPVVFGSSLGFWLLFPVGLLFFWSALRSKDRVAFATTMMALAFLVCNMPNTKIFEKYYDPFIIAFVILIEQPTQSSGALAKISRPLVLFAFALYPVISWWLFKSS